MILPGGFAHGDYLRTGAIARFSPVMPAVRDVRRARRPGARHLQRLPDPARGRAAAGRDAAQPRPEVSTASTCTCASSRPTRRSRRARAPGRCCACRSRTAKATTTRRPTCSSELEANRQVIFRYATPTGEVDRRGESERVAEQHRRHLQRRPQRRRPDAASRARVRARRSAAPTASCCLESVVHALSHEGAVAQRMTIDRRSMLERHGLTPRRVRAHRRAARARAEPDRARHLLGDVVRALQLQELARAPEDAADRRARACCRGPARTPARSTSATASPRSSRSSRTTIRRSSSRTRARRPASAASSATSSRWARGRSRC